MSYYGLLRSVQDPPISSRNQTQLFPVFLHYQLAQAQQRCSVQTHT